MDILPGEMINEKDKCKKCHGKKTVKENKVLEVSKYLPSLLINMIICYCWN